MLKQWLHRDCLLLAACLAVSACATPPPPMTEAQEHVDRAQVTLNNFLRDPEMTWLQNNISRAKGLLITPEVLKAGFIIGGSGGRAVFIARDPISGEWRGPVFYTMATGSVGFQAGVSSSEVVSLVMTDKGVNALMSSSMKVGGDASVAAGPVGAGAASTPNADFITFARSKGVYGGVNLDGTVITVNNDWNSAYYGKSVLPPDVLIRGNVKNPQAAALLSTAAKAGK
jgi:lipid-binding SYLF domain-containing protein